MATTILKATKQHTTEVRQIANSFGIKGCKLGTSCVLVGRQLTSVSKEVAHKFMDAVKAAGYHIDNESTARQIAHMGMSDMFMVNKLA